MKPDERKLIRTLQGWRDVARIPASNGTSVHTVSLGPEDQIVCTCQGFRIAGKGVACKHTRLYQQKRIPTHHLIPLS